MASRSANVNVRIEPEIKEQAEAILADLGISVSSFIDMTYRQVILHQGVPYPVTKTPIRTRTSMSDAEFNEMLSTGMRQVKDGKVYSVDEAFDRIMESF